MTPAQQALYRGKGGLWAAACAAQGWNVKDEEKRRGVTYEAALKINPHSVCYSVKHLNEDQITALFNLLRFYANPLNVAAARAVENPEEAQIDDACRRVCYAINDFGFDRNYVQAIANWACRKNQVSQWETLPLACLQDLVKTVERRAKAKNQPRRFQGAPKDYVLMPRRRFGERKVATADIPY